MTPTPVELERQTRQRERLAWAVLLASFAVFVLLTFGVSSLGWRIYTTATVGQEARLFVLEGTVLVRGQRDPGWIGAAPGMALAARSRVRTDATSEALVRLPDGSTIRLFRGSEVELAEMKRGRFVRDRQVVQVAIRQGQVTIGVAPVVEGERQFWLQAPQGMVVLAEGSYNVRLDNGVLLLKVRDRGEATVVLRAQRVTVAPNHRIELPPQGPLLEPMPAQEELLFNSRFEQGLRGWTWDNIIGFAEGITDTIGEVRLVDEAGSPVVQILRRGSLGGHVETFLRQDIFRDVSGFSTLKLRVRFKVAYQSLGGGGFMGSEYPVLIRVNYRSAGGDLFRVFGFYYQNVQNNRTDNGTLVPRNEWIEWEQELMLWDPPPVSIHSVQVSGSGWDYESFIGEVSLSGQ